MQNYHIDVEEIVANTVLKEEEEIIYSKMKSQENEVSVRENSAWPIWLVNLNSNTNIFLLILTCSLAICMFAGGACALIGYRRATEERRKQTHISTSAHEELRDRLMLALQDI